MKFLKSFIFKGDDPQPVYVYIGILIILVIAMLVMRMFEKGNFSDTLIIGVMGFIATWAGIFNRNERMK